MNIFLLLTFVVVSITLCCAQNDNGNVTKYVFDYYKNLPPLDSEAITDLLIAAQPGVTFPLLNSVPNSGFDCSAFKYPGYYADSSPQSRCQAFYRCEINGNQTGFLCPNETLFNQLTLTCDYYFNVDCAGFKTFNEYANSRLYQDRPLFDTPPKGYVSALSGLDQSFNFPDSKNGPVADTPPPVTSTNRPRAGKIIGTAPRSVILVLPASTAATMVTTTSPVTEAETEAVTETVTVLVVDTVTVPTVNPVTVPVNNFPVTPSAGGGFVLLVPGALAPSVNSSIPQVSLADVHVVASNVTTASV